MKVGEMMIKLIGIDMDETFLRQDKTYDVPLFKKIMKHIKQTNRVLVIASGNSYDKLQTFFDKEDLAEIYLAGDNGNLIVKGNTILASQRLCREDVLRIVAYINQLDGYYYLISTSKTVYSLDTLPSHAEKTFLRYNQEITKISTLEEIPYDEDIVRLAIMSDHSLAQNKAITLQLKKISQKIEAVTSGDSWIDVYNKQGGKGSAIQFFQKRYGIKKSETICFGDSLNDWSMMYETLYSVSMKNADSELALITRYQIESNQEQAVQKCLYRLLTTNHLAWLHAYKLPKKRYRLIQRVRQKYHKTSV
ncbi:MULTISPECIES: HAD-IIB family hydrolase [unclassified Granulicatella]|uniref:HAD-IIB family hydrolase n=1 Tax=unclassified Granulicatella TaxID=2630493 RepID=UPI001073D480|nr:MULTISPECIES: HAD family hydrolase [unclassified Granulicatella]MBF0780702.1 HAD family phosphatase [Granulicatella sp. 19428wC4_WM01]TFU94220.1 HAD family phosphatase [Granulicatella sp. WM01]